MKKNRLLLPLLVFSLSGCNGFTQETKVTITGYEEKDANNHTVKKSDGSSITEAHKWDDGEITVEATETTEGVKTYVCDNCGATKTEKVPFSGNSDNTHTHTWAENWEKDENSHWKKCTDSTCSEINSKATHGWDNGVVTKAATATTDGVKTYTCTVCQQTKTEKIPATGGGQQAHTHTWSTSWTSDNTYHWKKCTDSTCSEINSKATHSWNNGVVTTAATATTKGTKTYTCTVCQKTKTEEIPATGGGGGSQTSGTFTFNNDITQVQKIHTTDQENFLNYKGEYYKMTGSQLDGYNAKGNAENSFPKQVKLTWNYTAPSGKTLSKFEVVTGQKADLSDGYTITGTTAKELSFYNAFLGDNYFKVVAKFTDGTSDSSEIKVFKVDATAPRNLKVGTMSNCRDMGGRTNTSGGTIKQGLIYRTSDPATSGVGDVSEWTKRMGIKTEIYVKDGNNSSGPLGSTVKFVNASMDYGATPYSNMARNAERLRKVFSILGDQNNYPLMYHCRIGTDRTGICGVAINGLLGISFNETIQDYAFSNFGKIDNQRYVGKTPDNNGDDIAKYVNEILAMPGKTFQEQTIYSLLSIGIPAQTLQNVIDIMTLGNKATIPADITVAKGNDLTNNGGTKKTDNDYKNPEIYYEISGSSKSVSYNYTLSEAKKVTVVCYLGCTDSSSSKKLSAGIDLKIDGTSQTITNTKTYQLAGFGTTAQSRRTGYMYNILGEYDLTAGPHTITVAGKNSDTFYIGAISIIGGTSNISTESHNIDVEIGGTETGGTTVPEVDNSTLLNISNATGWNNPSTKWSEKSGSNTKATWNIINVLSAGNYKVSISCKMTSSSHSNRCFYNQYQNDPASSNPDTSSQSPYRYWIEIGSSSYYPDNTKTWGECGMSSGSFTEVELISCLTIPSGTTSISMIHGNIGYSLIIESVRFTPIA